MNDRAVIVLGLGPSGLFLTRQLRKITTNIYGIGRLDDVGLYSKYIKKNKRYVAQSENNLVQALTQIGTNEVEKPILYICSDQYLTLLLQSSVCWTNIVEIAGSGLDILHFINDKQEINDYCAKHGVLIPCSVAYDEYASDYDRQYPIIVKWTEKYLNAQSNPIGKIRICRSEEEFQQMNSELHDYKVATEDLFVQTYIRGSNAYQYSVGGYYRDGMPLADVVVSQAKQYPQGISAQIVTVRNRYADIVRDIARNFAKELAFSGFLEMEFKVDEETENAYLLDVNPRPWGWVSILGAAYPDFYRVLKGGHSEMPARPAVWESSLRKLLSIRNKQNTPLMKDDTEYARAYDIRDKNDPMPGCMIYLMALKKLRKRLIK